MTIFGRGRGAQAGDLAREAGHALSLEQVQVESLVPALLRDGSVDDFMARLGESDASLLQRLQDARARGAVLRYVAQLGADGASVGLQELPADTPSPTFG